jgi:hypothetical protein
MRRYIFSLILVLGLTALGATASSVAGKWVAVIPTGDGGELPTTFRFAVTGDKLTGSMENQFGEREISEGKVTGDDLSFTLHIEYERNQITYYYKGKMAGDEIKFTRERKRGQNTARDMEFVAKRKA